MTPWMNRDCHQYPDCSGLPRRNRCSSLTKSGPWYPTTLRFLQCRYFANYCVFRASITCNIDDIIVIGISEYLILLDWQWLRAWSSWKKTRQNLEGNPVEIEWLSTSRSSFIRFLAYVGLVPEGEIRWRYVSVLFASCRGIGGYQDGPRSMASQTIYQLSQLWPPHHSRQVIKTVCEGSSKDID